MSSSLLIRRLPFKFSINPQPRLFGRVFRMFSMEVNDPLHGSYHWYSERVVSAGTMIALALIPFSSLAQLADASLMVLLPIHMYQGFTAVVVDYLPKRKFGLIYTFSKGTLVLITGLTIYGFYRFNTENMGISAAVRKLWHETKEQKDS